MYPKNKEPTIGNPLRMSNFDLLDRYFSNELDKSELTTLNERLKSDPEFNQEFQEMKEIRLAVKAQARQNIKSLFTDIEDSLNKEQLTTNHQTAMKRILTVAASLILMVSVSYFVLNGNGQPTPQDVFTEYYKPYTNLNGQVRGEARNTESLSNAAYSAYDAGNYALAVENFETLVEVEKTAENYFYMGISNIEIGEYEAAVKNLNTTLNNFSTFSDQSKWYLSMALLADKKEEEGISILASLSLTKNAYAIKSSEILKSMNVELLETSEGEAGTVVEYPDTEGDLSPDGSGIQLERRYQYGEVYEFISGDVFTFLNESPMKGLKEGDMVEFIVLKRKKGGKSNGWAIITSRTK